MIDQEAFVQLAEELRWSTDRLSIRRMLQKDLAMQIVHESNPEIMRFIRDPLPQAQALERIKKLEDPWAAEEREWLGLAITERGRDEFAGLLALRIESYANETVEVGYRLAPDLHGKGLATEATASLLELLRLQARVHKVVAYCVAENTASWRVMEKLGMQREACLREYSRLAGKWHDELVYGWILDPDST